MTGAASFQIGTERRTNAGAPGEFFHGTLQQFAAGTLLGAAARAADPVDELLDAARSASLGQRGRAIWAAASVLDATAIAAIRCYSRSAPVPHAEIHVYRVRMIAFHSGPVALLDELRTRSGAAGLERLVAEYWQPSRPWWLLELLAPSLRVVEQVPAAREPEIYLRRWVHYNQDCDCACRL